MVKQSTIFTVGDFRVVKQGESCYIEEYDESEGEWIEHVDLSTSDTEEAKQSARDLHSETQPKCDGETTYYVLIDPFTRGQTPFSPEPEIKREHCVNLPARFETRQEAEQERRECGIGGDLILYFVQGKKAQIVDKSFTLGHLWGNHVR